MGWDEHKHTRGERGKFQKLTPPEPPYRSPRKLKLHLPKRRKVKP